MSEADISNPSCRGWPAVALGRLALVMSAGLLGIIAAQAGELNPHDMMLLDRLTWGVNASSAAHLQAVGVDRWLGEQLHPAADVALPDAAKKQIEAMPDVHKFPFDIAVAFDQQGKAANQITDPDLKRAAQQFPINVKSNRMRRQAKACLLARRDCMKMCSRCGTASPMARLPMVWMRHCGLSLF